MVNLKQIAIEENLIWLQTLNEPSQLPMPRLPGSFAFIEIKSTCIGESAN